MRRVHFGRRETLHRVDGVIWDAALSALPLSTTTNAAELRGRLAALGLTLTRASAATVQTSASTVVTSGIGVDDPRVGDGGYGRGLVLEESRQNITPNARSASGFALGTGTTPTTDYAAGPDGTVAADRYQVNSGGFSSYYVAASAARTFSVWVRHATGTGTSCIAIEGSSYPASLADTRTVDTTWQRVSIYKTGGLYYVLQDGRNVYPGTSAGARDVVIDLVQIEAGAFATELILTTGAAATRQPDRVLLDSAARIVRGGRVTLNARMALKGSIGGSNDYAADPYLWRYDGSNYASINRTTGAITIVIAGASYTTASGLTAARGDVVDYWIEAGGGSLQTVVKARKSTDGGVTFGAVTTLGTTSPQGTHPSATSMDLLSNAGTAGHLSCWLQRFRAYSPGRRIQWAQ